MCYAIILPVSRYPFPVLWDTLLSYHVVMSFVVPFCIVSSLLLSPHTYTYLFWICSIYPLCLSLPSDDTSISGQISFFTSLFAIVFLQPDGQMPSVKTVGGGNMSRELYFLTSSLRSSMRLELKHIDNSFIPNSSSVEKKMLQTTSLEGITQVGSFYIQSYVSVLLFISAFHYVHVFYYFVETLHL